jgi:hypothetical protein
MPHYDRALTRLTAAIPDFKVDDSSTQRDLSARIDLIQKETLFNSFDDGLRNKARRDCAKSKCDLVKLSLVENW